MKSKFTRKIDLITRITDKNLTKEMMDLFKEYEDEIVEWEKLYADLREDYIELEESKPMEEINKLYTLLKQREIILQGKSNYLYDCPQERRLEIVAIIVYIQQILLDNLKSKNEND